MERNSCSKNYDVFHAGPRGEKVEEKIGSERERKNERGKNERERERGKMREKGEN